MRFFELSRFCVLALSLSAPAHALSLEDSILYVLETNPEIKAAEANKQAIEFELDQAKAFRAPRFTLEGWAGTSYNDGTTTPDLTSSEDWINGYELTGRVTQRLFDGFETRSEIERQAYRIDAAALRVLERSEFLALEATRLYADVLRSRQLVSLAQTNLNYHNEVVARIRTAFDSGVVGVGDMQQAEERVFLAEDTLIGFKLDLENVEANFLEVVGVAPSGLGAVPALGSKVPATLDAALGTARRVNPSIRFMQADVGASEAQARRTAANKYPTVNLEAEARAGEDVRGYEGEERDFEIGLVVRYDFQGTSKRADRQEQIRRVNESRARLLTQTRLVEREVRQSWSSYESIGRRISVLQRQATLARELRANYEEEFRVGSRSLLDILNTQNALFQAEANLVNARSLEVFIKYRILAASGTLLPTLGIPAPEDAKVYARQQENAPAVGAAETTGKIDARSFKEWRKSLKK